MRAWFIIDFRSSGEWLGAPCASCRHAAPWADEGFDDLAVGSALSIAETLVARTGANDRLGLGLTTSQ